MDSSIFLVFKHSLHPHSSELSTSQGDSRGYDERHILDQHLDVEAAEGDGESMGRVSEVSV